MTDPTARPRLASTSRSAPAPRAPGDARLAGGEDAGRPAALDAVAAEATGRRTEGDGGVAFALAAEDDGLVAVAIDGVVDDAAAERLAALLLEVRALGRREVAIDLAELTHSTPALVRFLGHLRLHQVAGDGRLELHRPPADLVNALGDAVPDRLSIHEPRPALRAL
jgi:hypothetical protein